MILRVQPEDFFEAARRYAEASEIFLAEEPGGITLTAVHVPTDTMVTCLTEWTPDEATEAAERAGLKVRRGQWTTDEDEPGPNMGALWVAAVSYRSRTPMPGIWVEAFVDPPTPADVLRRLVEEFKQTGEMPDVDVDEFVRLAQPNVLIVSPEELRSFAIRGPLT